MSNFAVSKYYNPGTFFEDQSGTPTTATDVGSEVKTTSVSISGISLLSSNLTWTRDQFPELLGKSFILIARIKDSVQSNYLRIRSTLTFGGSTTNGDYSRPFPTFTTYTCNYATPAYTIQGTDKIPSDYIGNPTYTVGLHGYRNTGTNNILVDYIALFPDNVLYIQSIGIQFTTFLLNGKHVFGGTTGSNYTGEHLVIGKTINFSPNRYNILQALPGSDIDASTIADTLTYDIYYTPRYLIL